MRRRAGIGIGIVLLTMAAAAAGCARGESRSEGRAIPVTTKIVSDETTQAVWLVAPDRPGSWPVVYAMHGIGGSGRDMVELGTRLASAGVVVFAPTYNTDWSTERGFAQAVVDAECGYRFARSIAPEHGGDLSRPMTFVGWSLGATSVLALGLTEDVDPTGDIVTCFDEPPRADVIVAISGCYYEYEGRPVGVDSSAWGNTDATIVLVAGGRDETCAAWQSRRAADELRSAGYDVRLVILPDADHPAPVFHRIVDGEFVVTPDDPSGDRTVAVILDAIASAGTGSAS
jgi:dienelactone hydrolase